MATQHDIKTAMERAKATLARRVARSRVVIATDGVHDHPEPSWIKRLLMLTDRPAGTPRKELAKVLSALSALRLPVVLLDRKSGRVLGDRHLAAASKTSALVEGRAA